MEEAYVERHTIFETVVGSRAYGIHKPDSDYDKAGVMIPGPEYIFGNLKFEQYRSNETDRVIYDLRKAIGLIADNNPNMLDLLWTPQRCVVKTTPYWDEVVEKRDLFISKRCRYTFSGYAVAQLNRIKTHRKYLLDPPKEPPTRKDLGLPEVSIFPTAQLKAVCSAALHFIVEEEKQNFFNELDSIYGDYVIPTLARYIDPEQRALAMEWLQIGIKSQAKTFLNVGTQYLKDEYVDMAHKELSYYNTKADYDRYLEWKKSRNKKRAEMEEKFGFDLKHAAHLVRLCNMGVEILETGKINVDRTGIDADELVAIREGAWSYDKVEDYAKKSDEKLGVLYGTSTLRRSSDMKAINELCLKINESYYLNTHAKRHGS